MQSTDAAKAWLTYHEYERVRVLGRGQHGSAVLLRHWETGACVVSKEVLIDGMDVEELEKVTNEVLILSTLHHPNITAFHGSFQKAEKLSIVMEYADGGNLADTIVKQAASGEHFRTGRVLSWFAQLCSALQHVHAHRVLHRDLKTQNVFLTSAGEIKLGDFGISRALSTRTNLAETMCGTPYYLSPELVKGEPYHEPADVWALGVMLFELLTLRRPFTGSNIAALVLRITQGSYDNVTVM